MEVSHQRAEFTVKEFSIKKVLRLLIIAYLENQVSEVLISVSLKVKKF